MKNNIQVKLAFSGLVTLLIEQSSKGEPDDNHNLKFHELLRAAQSEILRSFGLPDTLENAIPLYFDHIPTEGEIDEIIKNLQENATGYLLSTPKLELKILQEAQEDGAYAFDVLPELKITTHFYTTFVFDNILMKKKDTVENILKELKMVNHPNILDAIGRLEMIGSKEEAEVVEMLRECGVKYIDQYIMFHSEFIRDYDYNNEINKLYLPDCLPEKQPKFFSRFEKVLKDNKINFQFLSGTKDIWARDYMPVQVNKEKFIQFRYNPDYLQSPYWRKTIPDVDAICKAINLKPVKSELIIDGGNVIRDQNKIIMCDKVFRENKNITKNELISQLEELFEVDKIIFVPWDKNDFTGHADGMVRFIDNETVFINDYSKEDAGFRKRLRKSIEDAGLKMVELPYNPYSNKSYDWANGIYMNYLEMKDLIIIPTFGMKEDEEAVLIIEEAFKGKKVATVDSTELAKKGGILNCISWTIGKN